MRKLKILTLATLIAVSGCKTQPTFHIVFADPCADISIVGDMAGKEFALGKPSGHEYMACYGRVMPTDVGHDFPAELDPSTGEITITLDGQKQAFDIEATREAK